MSWSTPVVFVGGPEDGKHVVLKYAPPSVYKVQIQEPLPTYVPTEDVVKPGTLRTFEYHIERLPGDNYVAYPAEWKAGYRNGYRNPLETLFTALTRGYFGRT